ncbi:hypothetical protein T07_6156 [Trichinella nelsoni]|uniref:Uncharacterized protein n=1 Tax=Trichinella nelsoni TaxID=6336 RepID=A0A0V0SK29_9BILA|nr:hypothetical protein T07_6156 [Trichinella nelsoni]
MPKRLCNGREQHECARKIDDIDSRVQIYASRYNNLTIVPLNLPLKYFNILKIEKVQGFSIDFTGGKVMMMMMMFALGCLLQAFGGRSRSPAS